MKNFFFKLMKFFLNVFVFIFFLMTFAYVLRVQILHGLADFLNVESPLKKADLIYVLGGDPMDRANKAAQLYKQGMGKKVAYVRVERTKFNHYLKKRGYPVPAQDEICHDILLEQGVPAEDILLIQGLRSTSTIEEAFLVRDFVLKNKYERLLLVTTAFHSRRALWIFEKVFDQVPVTIEMATVDDSLFNEKNWWKSEQGFLAYFNEYLKWVYYLYQYAGRNLVAPSKS